MQSSTESTMRTAISFALPLSLLSVLSLAVSVPPTQAAPKKQEYLLTVYDRQGPVTEKELTRFLRLLPQFREWASAKNEEAHPFLTKGKPDFKYSAQAAGWIQKQGWDARRFFCVMGRMAAAVVVIEEGNDFKGTRPADMPSVSQKEIELARTHLAELLQVGGASAPKVGVDTPSLPAKP